MFDKLTKLFARKSEYQPQDQAFIDSLNLEATSLQAIGEMKATGGWKILGAKLREEVAKEIEISIKNNTKIKLILDILSTVETKNASALLAEEIDKLIPN